VSRFRAWLQKVTSGYYRYHAVPGNLPRLHLFRWRLGWVWCRALSRRSQRSHISWDRLYRLVECWIPVARVLHPYPMQRFDATHPRREPYGAVKLVDDPAGESPASANYPVGTVVMSGDGAGDQAVGSPEVNDLVGWLESGLLRQEGKQSNRS
jgi:hypothetical protein